MSSVCVVELTGLPEFVFKLVDTGGEDGRTIGGGGGSESSASGRYGDGCAADGGNIVSGPWGWWERRRLALWSKCRRGLGRVDG